MGEQNSGKTLGGVEDMKSFLDAFNRHDVAGIMAYIAEDGVFETPRGKDLVGTRVEGAPAMAAYFTKMFERLPDIHFGEDSHWLSVDGEHGVSEWTLTGSTPDGGKVAFRGCDLFRLRDGKIILKDSYQKIVEP